MRTLKRVKQHHNDSHDVFKATHSLNGAVRRQNKLVRAEPDNAISHSKQGERTLVVTSCASGHQTGGGPKRGSWMQSRYTKLAGQAADKTSDVFVGVIAYLNGYTGQDVTNEQLKDIIEGGGGQIRVMPSAKCTHVFVHRNLSASKTEKLIKCRRNFTKFVKPAWAVDSALAGKRLSEAEYATPLLGESQTSVHEVFGHGPSLRVVHPAAASTALGFDIASPPRAVRRVATRGDDLAGLTSHQLPTLRNSKERVMGATRDADKAASTLRMRRTAATETPVLVLSSSLSSQSRSSQAQANASQERARTRSQTSGLLPSLVPTDGQSPPRDDNEDEDEDEWGLPPSAQVCKRA
ncbi:hypothetical protein OIV83_002156 [Microbotryomycetes sp. JL201]|nr:hypothetical protein OIV83_002156 [Microbotryomycetes sp. JL201]